MLLRAYIISIFMVKCVYIGRGFMEHCSHSVICFFWWLNHVLQPQCAAVLNSDKLTVYKLSEQLKKPRFPWKLADTQTELKGMWMLVFGLLADMLIKSAL